MKFERIPRKLKFYSYEFPYGTLISTYRIITHVAFGLFSKLRHATRAPLNGIEIRSTRRGMSLQRPNKIQFRIFRVSLRVSWV